MIYKAGKFKGHEINNRNWRKKEYNEWIVAIVDRLAEELAKKRDELGADLSPSDIAEAKLKVGKGCYSELLHGDEATVAECRSWG